MCKNLLVKKRSYFFSLILLFLSFSSTFAQIEKGIRRIGLAADISTRGKVNQSNIELRVGDIITDNLELDLEWVTRFYGGFQQATGIFQVGLIYHLEPKAKHIPGIGFTAGVPFVTGSKTNPTIISAFFNLDTFVNPNWAFTLKVGYERQSSGGRSKQKADQGFIARFGISTFWRQTSEAQKDKGIERAKWLQ